MGTRVRHISDKDLNVAEAMVESMEELVNISSVVHDGKEWYIFFTMLRTQMRDPISLEDKFNKNKGKNK